MKEFLWAGFLIIPLVLLGPDAGFGAPLTKISMNFRSQASVHQETVYLGDIAEIKGSPPFWVEKIGQLKIKASPAPGEILLLSREEIARKVRQINLSSLMTPFQIPDQIEVIREGRIVGEEEVSTLLETHLQRLMLDQNQTVKVKKILGGENIIVPLGLLSWEVKVPEAAVRGGDIGATIIARVEGREVRKFRIQAKLEIYATVAVAKAFLKRHQEIGEKDVQWVRKNIASLPSDIVTELKDVRGKRMTLALNSQETLRASMLENPPVVKKGDRVILVVENDLFKIITYGEAKEGGRKGDRIKLVNLSSKKEVCGRVLNFSTVQVDY